MLKSLKSSMSNTAQAAVEAANGGTVALDKLNKGFNLAALGAAALNAAVNFGLSILLSAAVNWINNYIHRVERAQQKTADFVGKYNEAQSAIESVTKSLDENYGRLSELRGIQLSGKWSDELEDERKQLKLQTLELEQQLKIAENKAKVTQRDAARALMNEVETTRTGNVTASWIVNDAAPNFNTAARTTVTREEAYKQAKARMLELNAVYAEGGELTDQQVRDYEQISSFLVSMMTMYQGWLDQAEDNPLIDAATVEIWAEQIRTILQLLSPNVTNVLNGIADPTAYVRNGINDLRDSRKDTDQTIWNGIQGKSKSELMGANSLTSESYAWILEQANAAQMSVEEYIDELVKLGIVTDDITDSNDKFNASLLDTAKAANNDLEAAAAAFEALESAVNDYNDAGYITDETLDSLNSKVPGAVEALFNENGALKENAAEALKSTSALITFVRAQLQAQLTAAQANYDNLKQELDDIQQKGLDAAAAMLGVQAAQDGLDAAKKNLADFEAWMKSGIFKSGSGSGGSGSRSIYSNEYEQITDLTEHYIKMSELRQKRMNEESSEYKAESRQQFLYYQQLAEQTYAEISRLRAKGYTEANADFRKLLQNYESYLGSMQDHPRLRGEQCG